VAREPGVLEAEAFYDNLMMGAQLMHEAWRHSVEKFVAIGTVRRRLDVTRAREYFGF
jgi:hypothetical protein